MHFVALISACLVMEITENIKIVSVGVVCVSIQPFCGDIQHKS